MGALRLGIHDLCQVFDPATQTPASVVQGALDLAAVAESWGYHRYWVGQHYGSRSGSASPSVLLAHLAARTRSIRLGSGCVCLRVHSALQVACDYRMLAAIAGPERIELGIGNGGPMGEAAALVAGHAVPPTRDGFLDDARRLLTHLREDGTERDGPFAVPIVRAPPVWVLGSGTETLALAAEEGLGLAFSWSTLKMPIADLPAYVEERYRSAFAGGSLDEPRVMLAANVVCAPTQAEAESIAERWSWFSRPNACGTPEQVAERLRLMADHVGTDEVILSCNIGDAEARLRSFELVAEALDARPVAAAAVP